MSRSEERLPSPQRRAEVALVLLILTAALTTLLALYDDLLTVSLTDLCKLGTGIALLCIAGSARVAPLRHLSASSVYIIIFCLFHFGLIASLAIGVEPSEPLADSVRLWIHRPETLEAVLLASLGVLSCTIAACLVLLFRKRAAISVHSTSPPPHPHLAPLGAALLTFWVIVWFSLIVHVGGWKALFGSYGDVLELTSDTPLHWVYLGIGLGLTLVAAGPPGLSRRIGWFAFGVFALVAFPLGLRGMVLFPLSAALVIAARRGTKVSGSMSLVLVAAVLALSAAAKEVRQSGLNRYDDFSFSLNPFDGLMELGSSLRPVVEVLTWEHAGDSRLGGASYWAPIERGLGRVLPGAFRRDAHKDERLMNVLVMERVGAIGFSPVAEAHYNFGPSGVLCVMFLIGIVLGMLDTWPATPLYLCLTGVVLVPLLINVRNSFTPVPAHIFVSTVATLLLFFVIGPEQSRNRPAPRAEPSRPPVAPRPTPPTPRSHPDASPRAAR